MRQVITQRQLLGMAATTCLSLALWSASYAQKNSKPLTLEGIANACKEQLSEEGVTFLIQQIETRGIAFQANASVEQRIRKECGYLSKQRLNDLVAAIRKKSLAERKRVMLTPANVNHPSYRHMVIHIGNSVVVSDNPSYTLIKMADENTLSFQNNPDGLVINGVIRDSHNLVIARIVNNLFSAPSSLNYEIRADDHTVYILDPDDKVVLFISYINPRTIKVLGRFYYPGLLPVIIEDGQQTMGGTIYRGNIFHDLPLPGKPSPKN